MPGTAAARHGRVAGALLALFVVLFDLVPAAAFPARFDDGVTSFVLCTAAGAVNVDQRPSGDSSDSPVAAGAICVFCLPFLHGALPPQGVVPVFMPPTRLLAVVGPGRVWHRPQAKLRGSVTARAPPRG